MCSRERFHEITEQLYKEYMQDELLSFLVERNPQKYGVIVLNAAEREAQKTVREMEVKNRGTSNIIPFPLIANA